MVYGRQFMEKDDLELKVRQLEERVSDLEDKTSEIVNPMDAFKTLLGALVNAVKDRFFKSKG
jgi:tetrahydromethanopterin S-methyltransferase subunit B